jgi:hypothetical protein
VALNTGKIKGLLKMSKKLSKSARENISYFSSMNIINGKSTWLKQGKYAPYRSKWEYLFALWLKDRDIQIVYEKEAFEIIDYNGYKIHYIPDFYIEQEDKWIEICTKYNPRNNKKILLFKEQYGYNIEIWTPKSFKDLELDKRYSKELNNL